MTQFDESSSAPDNLEYYIKFPNSNFNYGSLSGAGDDTSDDYVVVATDDEKKAVPVILLFGWAGCQDKYLAKYSQIYEDKGLITLRYTAPVKCLFWKRHQMRKIGEKLVKLLIDLNFDGHPVIVHCFSNGGAFLYQNFALALSKDGDATLNNPPPIVVKGVIFDSAPGKRRVLSLFRAISAIFGGHVLYNVPMSLVMTLFLSMIWFYEVVSNFISPSSTFQSNPLENLKNEGNRCPQHFIYSKTDDLIPYTDIEYFANYRKNLGIDVTKLCYEVSPHVKHLSENRESYVDSVLAFLSKCLNRNSSRGNTNN